VSKHNAANTGGALSSATHTIPRFPRPASQSLKTRRPGRSGPVRRSSVRHVETYAWPKNSSGPSAPKSPSTAKPRPAPPATACRCRTFLKTNNSSTSCSSRRRTLRVINNSPQESLQPKRHEDGSR
jgi:hypothetical protein